MIGLSLLVAAIPKPVIEDAGGIMLNGASGVISGVSDTVGGVFDSIASAIIPGYEASQRQKDIKKERAERGALAAATAKGDAALRAYAASLEQHINALEKRIALNEKTLGAANVSQDKRIDSVVKVMNAANANQDKRITALDASVKASSAERVRDTAALVARATALESSAREQLAKIQRALDGADSARSEAMRMGSQLVAAMGKWFDAPRVESEGDYDDANRMLSSVDAGRLPEYLSASTGEYGLFDAEVTEGSAAESSDDDMPVGDVDDEDFTAGLPVIGRL